MNTRRPAASRSPMRSPRTSQRRSPLSTIAATIARSQCVRSAAISASTSAGARIRGGVQAARTSGAPPCPGGTARPGTPGTHRPTAPRSGPPAPGAVTRTDPAGIPTCTAGFPHHRRFDPSRMTEMRRKITGITCRRVQCRAPDRPMRIVARGAVSPTRTDRELGVSAPAKRVAAREQTGFAARAPEPGRSATMV